MANIIDYLAWRGDLAIDESNFNEIDAAILARFAYIPFEKNAAVQEIDDLREFKLDDDKLLKAMRESNRFKDLRVGRQVDLLDPDTQTQFFAVTIKISDRLHVIAFRGTDNTIIGWKEDMNMSFSCPVNGQLQAAEYINKSAGELPGNFIITGHSKGGNLAVYGAAFCAVQDRVTAVYNFDGPGFFPDILETPNYQNIMPKLNTFVPTFSVFGLMLHHQDEQTVVKSDEFGIYQHDLYSWQVLGPRFVYAEEVSEISQDIDKTIKSWTAQMTPEQLSSFADAIYTLMSGTKARTVHELKANWAESAKSIVRSFSDMDEDTRTTLYNTLRLLVQSAVDNFEEKIETANEFPRS